MEYRVIMSIMMLSLVSIFANYHMKYSFCDFESIYKGSLIGSLIGFCLSLILRRSNSLRNELLIIPDKGNFLHNHIYFILGGAFNGGYFGYNYSVIYNASHLPGLKIGLLIIHCLICFGTVVVLYLAENYRTARSIFSLIYDPKIPSIRMKEYLASMVASIVLADYTSTIAVAYGGFFATMYYGLYVAFNWNRMLFGVGIGLFCTLNFLVNFYRYFYVIPKLKKAKEDEEFEKSFNDVVSV